MHPFTVLNDAVGDGVVLVVLRTLWVRTAERADVEVRPLLDCISFIGKVERRDCRGCEDDRFRRRGLRGEAFVEGEEGHAFSKEGCAALGGSGNGLGVPARHGCYAEDFAPV